MKVTIATIFLSSAALLGSIVSASPAATLTSSSCGPCGTATKTLSPTGCPETCPPRPCPALAKQTILPCCCQTQKEITTTVQGTCCPGCSILTYTAYAGCSTTLTAVSTSLPTTTTKPTTTTTTSLTTTSASPTYDGACGTVTVTQTPSVCPHSCPHRACPQYIVETQLPCSCQTKSPATATVSGPCCRGCVIPTVTGYSDCPAPPTTSASISNTKRQYARMY